MKVTSHDVAREAGVSQPTVSRALRGDARISDETRLRVLETALRLSYTPNAAARSLITSRTFAVGLVIENVRNFFYSTLVNAVYNALARRGYRLVLLQERTDASVENDLAQLLLGRAIDGAIFTAGTADTEPLDILSQSHLPVVTLNRFLENEVSDRVVSDNVQGGRLVAEHLLELNHRRVAMISGPANVVTSMDRAYGFRTALEDAGTPLEEELSLTGDFTYDSGYALCKELLERPDVPSAIFCQTDMIALGAMDAAREAGLRPPRNLSIVGFDDIEMSNWSSFDLTTVNQPIANMSEVAVNLLLERIEGDYDGSPRTEKFDTKLIARGSSAANPD